MDRYLRGLAVSTVVLWTAPSLAFAATDTAGTVPAWLTILLRGLSLVAVAFLLVDATLLRRVASGGAIAENISFLVLGVMCLAASVLFGYFAAILPDLSAEQAALGSDALVLLALVLLALYFGRMRLTLTAYLRAARAYAGVEPKDTQATESGSSEDVTGA